ncbi:uncharacterized protein [Cebidichthys violaceus]|uniref:uncharacterized protein isoform X2 n=1 Tax=Cebidichthys violaceus TaxID=271503 RepID=UPI0035CB5368
MCITDLTYLALCGTAPWKPDFAAAVWGPMVSSYVNLPKDIKTDPKTGMISLEPEDVVWSAEHLDPRFNYDFSNLKDTETYYRGGEVYNRPCGWQRFAIKVLDKYEDNTWLGNTNRSTDSVPGEWPVSYHGTREISVNAIIEKNYKVGIHNKYGDGIYSTPDFEIAKHYATKFSIDEHNYQVIMQNRINPKYRTICPEQQYWLVPIEDKNKEREIVKKAIRPYGILLTEV